MFGSCDFATMDWFCALPSGHQGPHMSDPLPSPTPDGPRCQECGGVTEPPTEIEAREGVRFCPRCQLYAPPAPEGGERVFVSSARQEGKTEALRRAASHTPAATGEQECVVGRWRFVRRDGRWASHVTEHVTSYVTGDGQDLIEEVRSLRSDLAAAREELADAAREINCVGTVAHRIRVLKQEHEAQSAAAEQQLHETRDHNEREEEKAAAREKEHEATIERLTAELRQLRAQAPHRVGCAWEHGQACTCRRGAE